MDTSIRTPLTKTTVREYALAGNATITLQSGKTDTYFTYKFQVSKDDANLFFIKLLRGQDNESDYTYVGCYYADTKYFHVAKAWKDKPILNCPSSIRAIDYFCRKIDNIPDNLYVYHEGRCGRCGRKLTTPESIERGLGPECYKR